MTKVSVLMPCYNAGNYLRLAIESILNQTFQDFEVIALDDCSTDDTLKTLLSYAKKDSRVRVIENSQNLGLIKTLNKGIDLINSKYIARMDQDDVCLPKRLEKQVGALENDNELDLVACRWTIIDGKGEKINNNLPRTFTTKSNLFESFFGPPFGHPTVMMRTTTIKKYYYRFSDETKHIEDYDLWSRMLLDGIKTKILADVLFQYRNFLGNTTNSHHDTQSKNMIFCGTKNLKDYLNVEIDECLQKTVFNRQETSISNVELRNAIDKFIEIKNLFVNRTQPNAEEIKQINYFSSNHISDILIQYILKNESPSYLTVARTTTKNLSTLMNAKNIYYSYLKFQSSFRRRLW